jgi:hypothetical protein
MAFWRVRANLASANFPFATSFGGRSIIVGQYDQNYDKNVNSQADVDKDRGIPQAFYMHNVMPTSQGYMSVGYTKLLDGLSAVNDFDSVFPIQNDELSRFLFCPAAGKNYIYDKVVGVWNSVSPISGLQQNVLVTTALVNAQSYLFYANKGCYKYNQETKLLDEVALVGVDVALVSGMCNANGYSILWDDNSISWSSLTDPLDFTPSLITGAGGGSLNEAKGRIIVCLPIAGGFIAYCEKNIVAARYTGNARFPYNFKELPNSGGIQTAESVSWQSNNVDHYAWTSAGAQKVGLSTCDNILPELTDFLSMKYFEDFNPTSMQFTESYLSTQLYNKLTMVSARYLVLSYGTSYAEFTHALVYDVVLKRWGKLKITHRDCFQWNSPNLYGELAYDELTVSYDGLGPDTTYDDFNDTIRSIEYPRENLAFVKANGEVQVVNFDYKQDTANGVFMLGKFEFRRNVFIVHQQSDVESINEGNTFKYYIAITLDGKTIEYPIEEATLIKSSPKMKKYGKQITGLNCLGVFVGAFNLNSMIIEFTEGGNR